MRECIIGTSDDCVCNGGKRACTGSFLLYSGHSGIGSLNSRRSVDGFAAELCWPGRAEMPDESVGCCVSLCVCGFQCCSQLQICHAASAAV